jgi:hypothetical protein
MAADDPSALDAARRVQDFANGVHRVCVAGGREDLARQLQREAERYRRADTTVVVVGTEKAGKSSLVNALLGDDVLPVDIDVATNTYIEVRHGPTVEVSVFLEGAAEPRIVDVDRLTEYATVDGNPDNDRRVSGIVLTHPHPLLASGLVLVDTPGVGGLEASHGQLTLAALRSADVLLFTFEAGAPLGRTELEFLDAATDRIENVVFVVTKIDAFRGWRTIMDDSRVLLQRHAPRFADAPMLGVSSKLRTAALAMTAEGADDRAQKILADSHVPELVATLQKAVNAGGSLKLANLVRAGASALELVEDGLRTTIRSAEADSAVVGELEQKKRKLNEVAQSAARWRADLDSESKRLGYDFDTKVDVGMAKLDQQLQKRINDKGDASLDTIVGEVDTALEALWVDLGTFVGEEVGRIVEQILATLAIDGVELPPAQLLLPDYLRETAGVRRERAESTDNEDWAAKLLQYYPIAFAAMMPVSLAGFVGVAIGGPIAWIIGGGVAGAMFTARRKQARVVKDRRAALEYTRSTLADARKVLTKQMGQMLADTRRHLEELIGGALTEQRTLLEAQLRENERLARDDVETRQRTRRDADQALQEAAGLRSTAEQLLPVLSSATSPTQ